MLDRRAPFPGDILDEVYAHDPIGKAALSGYKRQAQTMAVILGEGTLPDSDSTSWVVADVNHADFGREIEEHLLHNPATGLAFATRGIIIREGEELFVEKIPTANLDTWRKQRRLDGADLRLLGDHVDPHGQRHLELSKAVPLMKGNTDENFPIHGVKATKELHEAVMTGSGNFITYHSEWIRLSGVNRRSAAAHNHAALCEAFRLMHSYDQLDSSALAVCEHLARWLVQTEIAVERAPQNPD